MQHKFTLFLLLMLMTIPAMGQWGDLQIESLENQPKLSENDFKAFVESDKIFHTVLQIDSEEEANAYIQRELGMSLERYVFVMLKITISYSFLYEMGESNPNMFKETPYLAPSSTDLVYTRKYKNKIENVLSKMSQ